MKRDYNGELRELPSTYRDVIQSGISDDIVKAVRVQRPMLYVGSGGALAVARLAADLHTRSTGELALATTPLEAASASLSAETGVVLFSARGRHPDAALTIATARARGAAHLGVVSSLPRADLPPVLGSQDVRVGTVPTPPDGFLATNSLLGMALAVCLAHEAALPQTLPAFQRRDTRSVRRSCIALTGPGTAAVGVDIEARFVETGLATVQLSDYRNLAHGRHVGLDRHLEDFTVIGVVESGSAAIADRTLALLPAAVDLVELRSELAWPASVLDLLVQSMHLTAAVGQERGIDPGRPGVPTFGRRLYHLPVGKLLTTKKPDPVGRKLTGSGTGEAGRATYETALGDWLKTIRRTDLGAVVLDYDGTCCATWDRFRPPPDDVQQQIMRLLDVGIVVGFATGRGRSLHETTRSWLPKSLWPRVHVGLYNGTLLLRLADDPPDAADCEGPLADAADRLDALGLPDSLLVERRRTQISIASGQIPGTHLLHLVRSVLARPPMLECKAFASGHSVDVVASEGGKVAVLESVAKEAQGATLAIGDQGQIDGNDFALLAATAVSLSVDRCSADPTRCWNLDSRGERGPALLVRYLKAIQTRSSGTRLVWKP